MTVQDIRNQPGFERFLLPPAKDEILAAAAHGPIVTINVSRHRCDALIVLPTRIECVELSHDVYKGIQEHGKNLTTPSNTMLEWLWDYIVSPVLARLGILAPSPSGQQWPRIWWIPTGSLVGFPLHAAGYHREQQGRTTLDRVVSSYATSIRSITHIIDSSQQARDKVSAESEISLVTMGSTPKQIELPFAQRETQSVKDACKSMGLQCIVPITRKTEVLSAMQSSDIFHFAGHGGTHPDPLKSRLLLDDWQTDPLTVDSLLQTNLSSRPPFLAYLSACGTGQVKDKDSIDESIHLTAAFQLAGFRHVIGTLWNVEDGVCVDMARIVYEVLRDNGINDKAVREGLHHASRKLRDRWVLNEQVGSEGPQDLRSVRDANIGDDTYIAAHWIPYVHYGA